MKIDGLPPEVRGAVDYAIRILASRCLNHPRLDEDPTPVIANERDKLLDEIRHGEVQEPWIEKVKKPDVQHNGKKKGRIAV